MKKSRRCTALSSVIAMAVALLAAVGISTGSSASAYPATTCASISVSATSPVAGTSITVTGEGFTPGVALTLVLEAQPDTQGHSTVGHVTASAGGTFVFTLVVPPNSGLHNLVAIGDALTSLCPADPFASLDIRAASTGTSSGGLASTGSDVLGVLGLAVVLIAAGTLATVSGRRKRSRRHTRAW